MKRDTYTYESPTDDFVESSHQKYRIPPNHVWYRHGFLHSVYYYAVYTTFYLASVVYARLNLHVKIVNKKALKPYRHKAIFIYGNHTLPQGDIALTVLLNYPHKVSAIMSPANFGIPVIGPLLRRCDFLPVPKNHAQSAAFKEAMGQLVSERSSIAIYPEAHVWPYYTKIRPFSDRSFKYPPRYEVPAFVSTVTYQKRAFRNRPKVSVFVDGPFFPNANLDEEAQRAELAHRVHEVMEKRSRASSFEYRQYRKRDA